MRLFLPVGFIATTLALAPVRFDREKVFRVKPQDEKQANVIKDLAKSNKLDFWYPDATHHVAANMTVDFRVSEKESQAIQSALDQNQMHYEIPLFIETNLSQNMTKYEFFVSKFAISCLPYQVTSEKAFFFWLR